jgi:hypothetical protein
VSGPLSSDEIEFGPRRRGLLRIVGLCFIPADMRDACAERLWRGYLEHGREPLASVDALKEVREELLDGVNYPAIHLAQGKRLDWRWRLATVLIGVAWRLLRRVHR